MLTDTTALNLGTAGSLPGHARDCLFWECDAAAGGEVPDPRLEKEAWLSMVMLEWGSCGRVAWSCSTAVGHALYAPPALLPRARSFPTSPVSADAVLMTQLSATDAAAAQARNVHTALLDGVLRDLIRRGVRAVEAFGYREVEDITAAAAEVDPAQLLRAVPLAAGPDCSGPRCMIPAGTLALLGFEEIAPHHRYPRFRMELGRDLGWKAEVEAALEGLLSDAGVDAGGQLVGAGGVRTGAPVARRDG